MKQIFPLLLLAIVITSCSGQATTSAIGEPKLKADASTKETNSVRRAFQDNAGNIWFCTTGDGVYRYDGKTFVNYTEKNGLSSNKVFCALNDKDGNVWFGTDAGVCQYKAAVAQRADSDVFTCFPVTGNFFVGKAVHRTEVWSMMQDKSGVIWLGTRDDGIFRFDGKTFTPFLDNANVANESKLRINAVNSIVQDKTGAIWFATWFEGLVRYDGKSLVAFKPNNEVWYSSLFQDKDGVIWIGRRTKGLMRFDPTEKQSNGSPVFTNVVQHGTVDSCSVGVLAQDRHGALWLGSIHSNLTRRDEAGGLWRYDPTAEKSGKPAFKNFTAKDGLPNNNAWSTMEDKAGNLWIGTTHTGLYRYDPSAELRTGSQTFVSFSE